MRSPPSRWMYRGRWGITAASPSPSESASSAAAGAVHRRGAGIQGADQHRAAPAGAGRRRAARRGGQTLGSDAEGVIHLKDQRRTPTKVIKLSPRLGQGRSRRRTRDQPPHGWPIPTQPNCSRFSPTSPKRKRSSNTTVSDVIACMRLKSRDRAFDCSRRLRLSRSTRGRCRRTGPTRAHRGGSALDGYPAAVDGIGAIGVRGQRRHAVADTVIPLGRWIGTGRSSRDITAPRCIPAP